MMMFGSLALALAGASSAQIDDAHCGIHPTEDAFYAAARAPSGIPLGLGIETGMSVEEARRRLGDRPYHALSVVPGMDVYTTVTDFRGRVTSVRLYSVQGAEHARAAITERLGAPMASVHDHSQGSSAFPPRARKRFSIAGATVRVSSRRLVRNRDFRFS